MFNNGINLQVKESLSLGLNFLKSNWKLAGIVSYMIFTTYQLIELQQRSQNIESNTDVAPYEPPAAEPADMSIEEIKSNVRNMQSDLEEIKSKQDNHIAYPR